MRIGQAEVIAFLSDPASYGREGCVERFETHANLIFLAGLDAWKIKRAVRFPYLDFSTLDKRHAACVRETEVNRRYAPDIYLGCVAITRSSCRGGLEFGGSGEVVEWAVHMRRFEQSAILSNVATTAGITPELARRVADIVFESHRQADRAVPVRGVAAIDDVVTSLFRSLARSHRFNGADVQTFSRKAQTQLDRARTTLNDRAARGYVRRCHGDLHLANIVLWQGRPVLYDAIEFDENIATIDTLYDLAFLLMDLDRHEQRRAANEVLNRYLWRSNDDLDLRGLRALPLLLGVTAGVRSVVSVDRAAQERGGASQRDEERAQAYLRAAIDYLTPLPPQLIAVGGLSGSGKTTLGAALAPRIGSAPGAMHVRSDLERKSLFGAQETTRLGADSYLPKVSQEVYESLRRKARIALEAGHSVVVDAVYSRPEERNAIEAIADAVGVPFRGLWLQANPDKLISRVTARRNDASDATVSVVQQQLGADTGPFSAAWTAIDANGSVEEILQGASLIVGFRCAICRSASSD